MTAAGIEYCGPILPDGKLHRFKANRDHHRNSWYILFLGPPPAGAFGCWKHGIKETWHDKSHTSSQLELQRIRKQQRESKAKLKAVATAREKKAREIATWILKRAKPVATHPYLERKRVKSNGELRQYHSVLVLPLRDLNGDLHSLQFIGADGSKRFLTGGRLSSCFFTLAHKPTGPVCICEGYATGASIHEATGYSVVCAMNCGNLRNVANAIRELWPQREILLAADNDQFTDGNPGLTNAIAAAKAIGARLAVPQFKSATNKPSDFNDIAVAETIAIVRQQIEAAAVPAETPHGDGGKTPRKSDATRLVQFAEEFTFFHDPQDRPFVRLEISGHVEVWPMESTKFRKLLAGTFYNRAGKTVNRNALADAIATLAGRACHDSPEDSVFLRVAPHGENILIDLCDADWRVVEVAKDGWRLLDESPVAFIRTGAMRPLPEPIPRGGAIDSLWKLLNVTEDQRPLVAAALLNALQPHGPYFVLNFVGEQGAAKSCAAKIIRQLVDPNEAPLRSPPREERDLLAQAANNWCVALDNLSNLQPWLSDAICRLSTGGGHSARTLYTDLEEISISLKRPSIVNGIEDVAVRPDLAERALQIELETIDGDKRIPEKELWREFEAHRAAIFSGILDALSCALRELPTVKLDSLPRMADAAEWATAGETAFGWKRGTFMAAYLDNLNEGAIAAVEADPIGVVIRQLLNAENAEWSGEPAQLLVTLNKSASEDQKRARNWPKNARALSARMRRLAPALRRVGIVIDSGPKGKRRETRLCKMRDFASLASTTPVTAPDDANDANLPQLQPPRAQTPAHELVEELI